MGSGMAYSQLQSHIASHLPYVKALFTQLGMKVAGLAS